MELEFSRQIFEKYSNIRFHENPSSESRVVPCGQTDGRTDMTKLIAAFLNFANTPKKEFSYPVLPGLWMKIAVGRFAGFEILPNDV
jgi:hypothetical protein